MNLLLVLASLVLAVLWSRSLWRTVTFDGLGRRPAPRPPAREWGTTASPSRPYAV